jgi:hypothetical protein
VVSASRRSKGHESKRLRDRQGTHCLPERPAPSFELEQGDSGQAQERSCLDREHRRRTLRERPHRSHLIVACGREVRRSAPNPAASCKSLNLERWASPHSLDSLLGQAGRERRSAPEQATASTARYVAHHVRPLPPVPQKQAGNAVAETRLTTTCLWRRAHGSQSYARTVSADRRIRTARSASVAWLKGGALRE